MRKRQLPRPANGEKTPAYNNKPKWAGSNAETMVGSSTTIPLHIHWIVLQKAEKCQEKSDGLKHQKR